MNPARTPKKTRFAGPALAAVAATVVLGLHAPAARGADDKGSCLASYEHSQMFRRELKLGSARDELRNCARAVCPALVRTDCIAWLDQVATEFPSLAIHAIKNGQDIADVKVFEDSEMVAARLDGRSLEVEPGEHTFRFETEGAAPVVIHLVVREREKDRPVPVNFVTPRSDEAAQTGTPARAAPSLMPGMFVLGGVGVAGLAAFGVLGLVGKGDQNSLSSTCSPNCAQGSIDKVRTEYIAADVALGVGAAGLASAAIWYFVRQRVITGAASSRETLAVDPRRGGAVIEWNGTL